MIHTLFNYHIDLKFTEFLINIFSLLNTEKIQATYNSNEIVDFEEFFEIKIHTQNFSLIFQIHSFAKTLTINEFQKFLVEYLFNLFHISVIHKEYDDILFFISY